MTNIDFLHLFELMGRPSSANSRHVRARAGRNELKFSKNVVCIDIRGPNVGNLSIIDLPGLIQTVEKEEDERFIRTISVRF